jgi:SH3 domain-containing protein
VVIKTFSLPQSSFISHAGRSEHDNFVFTPKTNFSPGTKLALESADFTLRGTINLITTGNRNWAVGLRGIVGIASCAMGLSVVYFGYGIGTESPKKDAVAKISAVDPKDSKRPVRAMNLALGNMVFFAQDLGFTVQSAKDSYVDESKVAARIEAQLNALRELYRHEVAKNSALAGTLVLQFNIGPTGAVTQVRELSSRLSDDEFKKTIAGEASKWSFTEIVTENMLVTCPLLFVHEGMDITTLVRWEKTLGNQPAVARAPGNPASMQVANTVQAAPARAAAATQGTAVKSEAKEFQIKYATSLRKDPNFTSVTLTTFTIGTKVIVLGKHGDWLEVRSSNNGPTGFIRKEFVTSVDVARN